MKITDVRLGMLRVPLKTPFRTAMRTVEAVEDIVVSVHTDAGNVGHGAAAATALITGDTHGSVADVIGRLIAPRVVGMEVADLHRLLQVIHGLAVHNTGARAAMEIAIHDLWAQHHGAPLYRLLGGGEPVLATDITISTGDAAQMVADAVSAVERGFASLKVKVGGEPAADLERVRAIHAAVAGRASLRLDANQGWTPKQAVHAIRALEDAGVGLELVEQPVNARDVAGLKFVTRRVHTPVMADESAFDALDVIDLLRQRAADIINIKLMKAGGISGAIRIADIAAAYGVECMIGCMIESAIGVAAAAHVAAARPQTIRKVDLDVPALCAFNPVDGGVEFDQARITIGDAPGLGIRAVRGVQPLGPAAIPGRETGP